MPSPHVALRKDQYWFISFQLQWRPAGEGIGPSQNTFESAKLQIYAFFYNSGKIVKVTLLLLVNMMLHRKRFSELTGLLDL